MPTRVQNSRAFTLIEVLSTLLILAITATIALEAMANTDAGLRSQRAAREAVSAIRFARMRAMSDGVSYKVRFNVSGKTISVIDPNNGNTTLAAPVPGGVMLIKLSDAQSEVANVTMAASINGDSTDPYDVTYSANGSTTNSGTISFTYGPTSKVLQIPNVGDPTIVGDPWRP